MLLIKSTQNKIKVYFWFLALKLDLNTSDGKIITEQFRQAGEAKCEDWEECLLIKRFCLKWQSVESDNNQLTQKCTSNYNS